MAYSSGDSDPPRDDPARMTLLSTAQHIARASRQRSARPSRSDPGRQRAGSRRRRTRRLSVVADLGNVGFGERAGSPAGQRRRHAVQRADGFDPPQNPATFRPAGTRRSQPSPGPRCSRRNGRSMSPPIPSTNSRSRSTASSSRSRRIATRWRPTCACAPSIRATSSRASSQVEDGLTLRAFKDGSPYANEDMFSAASPAHQRPMHARCRNAGHVPDRSGASRAPI